ncbi:ribonuclease E/G [Phreatobacter sp.]|uniref:Rne/Rng family ribonuclease n=1 Tax=Phreatobacter sp. TaxID=1966341 RepID=UPI0022C6111F|nr:ribonuclease E/G [Phreatobacter sp.]MCZ8317083.1 ribonuclease E/G [Phreatobacter sp.]
MANKMLIDAAHPEETRVVVVRGNRVEEFDFESQSRKQLRGNIYLAKVTRVEPSLQAAFIEYGGNRHGFLAFSEIHPDYYQIPVADREALLAEEARQHRDEDDEENGRGRRSDRGKSGNGRRRRRGERRPRNEAAEARTSEAVSGEAELETETTTEAGEAAETHETVATEATEVGNEAPVAAEASEAAEAPATSDEPSEGREAGDDDHDDEDDDEDEGENGASEEDQVESVGAGDAYEDMPDRSFRPRKQYKIQEVIKRRQVMLVQVVKEERGNKGAALTTYLSLAGRYSVLMPNTARGGGISRKITNTADRKKLKEIASELDVPEGMGVILRTAGANRTKTEVRRDFEYLLRMWETVRETTLQSHAPTLVYEEGSLIKRSIRDLYNKDIEEVLVAGDEGYKEAKDFMRMLMPSHAKNVRPYREPQPIFARSGVEAQLDAMFSNTVQLKSGGYIVINPTEALVAIDVNSGRSTREHNIEDTALRTNLEAADEVARQLRLRDLAGLIVVDFIDMDEGRNNRAVEKRMKDALKNDRARIQVGRISHFGLLEMSRQRIRTGVLESSTETCPTCAGLGHVRSVSSVALHLLRSVEEQLLRAATHDVIVRTRTAVALYVLNNKRAHLHELETRFGVSIDIAADEAITGTHMFAIEKGAQVHTPETAYKPPAALPVPVEPEDLVEDEVIEEAEEDETVSREAEGGERSRERGERSERGESDEAGERRRRRRRRRRRGRNGEREEGLEAGNGSDDDSAEGEDGSGEDNGEEAEEAEAGARDGEVSDEESAENERRRRRRGRRGGRRGRREDEEGSAEATSGEGETDGEAEAPAGDDPFPVAEEAEAAPAPRHAGRRGRGARAVAITEDGAEAPAPGPVAAEAPVAEEAPRRRRTPPAEPLNTARVAEQAAPAPVGAEPAAPEPAPEPVKRRRTPDPEPVEVVQSTDAAGPRRAGWWNRKGA